MKPTRNNPLKIIFLTAICSFFSGFSQAGLIDRGNGLIYDDLLNVTWLQDANLAASELFGEITNPYYGTGAGTLSFPAAFEWLDNMNANNYLSVNTWRLPNMDRNSDTTVDLCSQGVECPDNELGHMFYFNFNGKKDDNLTGNHDLFVNILERGYFSSSFANPSDTSLSHPNPSQLAVFTFNGGVFGLTTPLLNNSRHRPVWAVTDGDVSSIPLPTAFWLFGSSIMGLLGLSKKDRLIL